MKYSKGNYNRLLVQDMYYVDLDEEYLE